MVGVSAAPTLLPPYFTSHAHRIASKTKRPPGNRAAFSLSRENSSNGGKRSRQNFLDKIL
jgi:hypothetical protein